MKLNGDNFAYIDGANLYNGIKDLGWKLDYTRFRVWLSEKYGVSKAFIFIGFIPEHNNIYTYLEKSGFVLVYKDITFDKNKKPKGNCDADLVLQVVSDGYENKYNRAVIVASDGDYSRLVKFLTERNKLEVVLSPYRKDLCSILLKKTNAPISYMSERKSTLKLNKNEKAPDGDKTP